MAGSVQRALRMLVELSEGPLTISELGRRLDVHRTTSLRLLRDLEAQKFVRREETGHYRLGPRMAVLAHAALARHDSLALARPHLHELGRLSGHTTHLAALEGGEVVYVDKVESSHAVRMYSRIGFTAPMHATGVGKAILAFTSVRTRDELLGKPPFPAYTVNTHTERESLDEDLRAITKNGWALDDFEHEEFIHCIAAPIFDARGEVLASISISTPRMVMDRDGLRALVPNLIRTASRISEELGWDAV